LSPDTRAGLAAAPAHQAFAAFTNRDFRIYVLGGTAAMMADNIEHVISYKVMFDKFHSPALAGFAVISHWVPYLFLAGFTGALADRFDVRRLIQVGMLLFIGVSIGWGIMFATDTVSLGAAMLLLIVHGLAGVIWMPAAQVLIHQIVGPAQLPSAVRLNATGRYLGFLVGPLLGAGLLLGLGPAPGIFVNALIYTPLLIWLVNAPYGAAAKEPRAVRPAVRGFADITSTMAVVLRSPVLLSMTVLVGAASFFVGNAYQAQMPELARDLQHGRPDFTYGLLLGADAAGGLLGGLILETRGWLRPEPRTAFRAGDDLGRRAVRVRPSARLPPGARPAVRRGLRRARLQLHGAGPGTDQRARPDPGSRDRGVLHVGQWTADVQRTVGGIARGPHRDSQFTRL
jgi:MFS family permease